MNNKLYAYKHSPIISKDSLETITDFPSQERFIKKEEYNMDDRLEITDKEYIEMIAKYYKIDERN